MDTIKKDIVIIPRIAAYARANDLLDGTELSIPDDAALAKHLTATLRNEDKRLLVRVYLHAMVEKGTTEYEALPTDVKMQDVTADSLKALALTDSDAKYEACTLILHKILYSHKGEDRDYDFIIAVITKLSL